MNSLAVTDRASANVARAPRVSLADIEAAIKVKHEFTLGAALDALGKAVPIDSATQRMSICALEMKNGYVVIGKSAPASPANFNPVIGAQFAYEDAVRHLWPLMGYALRDKLTNA